MSKLSSYRPDIDGLRAVAVLCVILFHLKTNHFQGGFIGVDIFFVISGYLITQILYRENRNHTFSIAHFYERRFRRILPALTVVLAATGLASWFSYYPLQLVDIAQSLLATVLSGANVYFMQTADYFTAPEAFMPLLHMWSLGVEEQFYIFFPFVLILIRRYGHSRYVFWCALLAAASFALSVALVYTVPSMAFYLVFSRAWELLAGSLLALGALPVLKTRWQQEGTALLGVAMLAASLLTLDKSALFPGLNAVLPTLGTVAIIYAGMQGRPLVNRLLSLKPLVFTGLISYSLYLWHWPVIIFTKVHVTDSFTNPQRLGLLAISFLLASLTWYVVERPFRKNTFLTRKQIFQLSLAVLAALGAAGLAVVVFAGFPQRVPQQALELSSYLKYDTTPVFRKGTCFIGSAPGIRTYHPEICLQTSPDKPNILLVGDSHSGHFYQGLKAVLSGANILQAGGSGCKPLLNTGGENPCASLRDDILLRYLPAHKMDAVIIAARWKPEDLKPLQATLEYLAKLPTVPRIYVLGRVPEYETSLPFLLARQIETGNTQLAHSKQNKGIAAIDTLFAKATFPPNVTYVSSYQALCHGPEGCETQTEAGIPLQFDYGHLTQEGSVLTVQRMVQNGVFQEYATPAAQPETPR